MKSQQVFTKDQVKRMANILDNAGQILFASVVLPLIIGLLDLPSSRMILSVGSMSMFLCWWGSLRLERISS